MKPRTLFTIAGINVQFNQSGLIGTAVLWLVLTLLAWWWLPLSPTQVVLFGVAATFLHWFGEFLHQMGHAAVARRLGYPMQRIRAWYVLAAGLYPKDEPPLPAKIHIRRALGGPAVSLILSILGVVLVGVLRPFAGLPFYLAVFFALENFFVFFIGALLPLGFTDGSTLLYWWPKRGQAPVSREQ
jgi:hypothetical protein